MDNSDKRRRTKQAKIMSKKGGSKKGPTVPSGSHKPISLREEISGKKQLKGGSNNVKSILKVQHFQKLAVWASGEASIPSLGAFFGHRLAAVGQAAGTPPDNSLVQCESCETILQPGYNCTVRIEKNKVKARHRRRKPSLSMQNNVVYKCHFCSHWNMKRGTPKGHMKEICPSKVKPSLISEPAKSMRKKKYVSSEEATRIKDEVPMINEMVLPAVGKETPMPTSPTTPLVRIGTALLDRKKRKRNKTGSKKKGECDSRSDPVDMEKTVSASSKRRRKSWTSLKEIAENSEHVNSRSITNLTIPFSL